MAAASTMQYGRQKKSGYGKASKSSWNNTFFDGSDDELAAPAPAPVPKARSTVQRTPSVKESYPVQKVPAKKAPSPATTKAKAAKKDAFDVPSSGDEASPSPKAVSRPAFRPRRTLVDDRAAVDTPLAPWERQQRLTNQGAKEGSAAGMEPDAQLRADLDGAAKLGMSRRIRSTAVKETASQSRALEQDMRVETPATVSSAAARLAARKRAAAPTALSAAGRRNDNAGALRPRNAVTEETPRKRARTMPPDEERTSEVVMMEAASPPICSGNEPTMSANDADIGVVDFPDSSAGESSKPSKRSSPRANLKPARRSKPNSSSTHATPRKGMSAPARLAEMLPEGTDVTESSTPSLSSTSRDRTPQQPSTPPSRSQISPDTAIRSGGNMTPKQAQLWNNLLPSQTIAPSPSALAIRDLTISGERQRGKETSSTARRSTKSSANVPRRRTRLVDRLKASTQSSSEDESSGAGSDEDTDMADSTEAPPKPAVLRAESSEIWKADTLASQSQARNQPSVPPAGGLKRTYASQRSHLEDSFVDGLMVGLVEDTPKQPTARVRTLHKSQSQSQKDGFDLDDSDGEGTGMGAIRSIHELRAAGRSIRGTEDIEQLLEDIENSAPSHKSRRRNALIEIATKLTDKNFASRFIGQGCDLRLARQCVRPGDDIADFVLAAAVAFLLASDPPEHTVRTLRDSNVTVWLASLLSATGDIRKVAKQRQHNMAKAAQASLTKLAETLQSQASVWSEQMPAAMTTRLVALTGMDMLVRKIRRGGDKSELLPGDSLKLLLPDVEDTTGLDQEIDTALSISILESLSTASLTLAWGPSVLQRIAHILTSLESSSPPRRHALFLTLRLFLNLTTDNPRNCALLATQPSVHYLLQTVLDGFAAITIDTASEDEEKRALALDLLVLALGILINLFEHSSEARTHATVSPVTLLTPLVQTFTAGQRRMLDAESVEESISNVAFGYLSVMLANLCQDRNARGVVAAALPGEGLGLLVGAVEEFVLYHQQVDRMNFEGEEGGAVWGTFTEKLTQVLERVKGVEESQS